MSRASYAPLCAGLSTISSGVTGFGDAILFHICASVARAALRVPPESEGEELRFAVLCTGVISLVSLPITIFLARAHLLKYRAYGFTMAITGVLFLPLGAAALTLGDLRVVEVTVGLVFAGFASSRLVGEVLERAKERRASRGGIVVESVGAGTGADACASGMVATPGATTTSSESAAGVVIGASEAAASPATSSASLSAVGADDAIMLLGSGICGRLRARVDAILPSPGGAEECDGGDEAASHAPPVLPSRALLVFFAAGAGAGFLNGLLGTGGPPQMAAFAILRTRKSALRAIAVAYACVEVPIRLIIWSQSLRSSIDVKDGGTYFGVAALALSGYLTGNALRAHVNSRMLLNILLAIVLLSSTILLGALKSAAIAASCALALIAYGTFLVALYYTWPDTCARCNTSGALR